MAPSLQFLINLGIPLATVLFAYIVGTILERRHFRDILQQAIDEEAAQLSQRDDRG